MRVLDVGELARYIKEVFTLDPVLGDVWVQGEVSNLSRPASGHVYFTLKDGMAQLACVMFRREAAFQAVQLENGMGILAHGRVDIYETRGTYQLYVDLLERQGIGVLYAQFDALKQRLEAEGLFAPDRKRPLPRCPVNIGIVTSSSGAVLHDIMTVLSRRWPRAQLLLAPAQVQGREAAPSICRALALLAKATDVEIIIVARGGGSIEDLWAFNEEVVARSIVACPKPVISAVGHETDFTIADFVADLRAPTPSAAAELVTPNVVEEYERVRVLRGRLAELVAEQMDESAQQLEAVRHRLTLHAPLAEIRRSRQRLDELEESARFRLKRRLDTDRQRLESLVRQVGLLDPQGTLRRGYAIVRRVTDGTVLTNPAVVEADELLDVQLAHGSLAARAIRPTPATDRG